MRYQEQPLQSSYTTAIQAQNGAAVRFADSIIYPGGGGQPRDRAWLTQGDSRYEVLAATGDGWLTLDRPLAGNASVTQHIDGVQRLQNCRYHTLLHLIAAIAADSGARVTSNQIEADHARIELRWPEAASATAFSLAALLATLNQAIAADAPVSARVVDRSALADESAHVRTLVSLIPEAVVRIRLVRIAGFDEEACAGTHVTHTGAIPTPVTLAMNRKGATKRRLKITLPTPEVQ